jgi:hypothetical protein
MRNWNKVWDGANFVLPPTRHRTGVGNPRNALFFLAACRLATSAENFLFMNRHKKNKKTDISDLFQYEAAHIYLVLDREELSSVTKQNGRNIRGSKQGFGVGVGFGKNFRWSRSR